MSLFALLIVVTCLVLAAFHYWREDAAQRNEDPVRTFLPWAAKGLLVPILVWTFFNSGIPFSALIPQIAQAQAAGKWADTFIQITAGVLFVIVSWWTAITLAWISFRVFERSEHRSELLTTAGIWMVAVVPVAGLIVVAAHLGGVGLACALIFGAMAHATLPLILPKPRPTYSRALAKIAFDKFNEAEWEIIKQLEDEENDFDGWMLLADLYATHFHDLPSAERTVCELCDDPKTNAAQVAIALNRLADWHLRLDNNPVNARWALEQLCQRLPESHLARMAQMRIAQLPATREEWTRARQGRTVVLERLPDLPQIVTRRESGEAPVAPTAAAPRPTAEHVERDPQSAALAEANQCVEHLKKDPDDLITRERFARLLAESLGKPEPAIEQLDLLLGVAQQAEQRAQWMMLQAEWHSRLRRDPDAAAAIWQRVISEFPASGQAFDAQRRLYLRQIEASVRERSKRAARHVATAKAESPHPRA